MRDRLRHVAQFAAGRPSRRCTASRSAAFRSRASAIRRIRAPSERVFLQTARGPRRAELARGGGADQPGAHRVHPAARAAASTSSSSSASATTTRIHGARAVPGKAILVPTAERDGALGLSIFAPVFRGVRALMYNSFEERALINGVSSNHDVPGVVVGVGSDIPDEASPARFRQKFDIRDRFADLRRPHRREQGLRRAVRFLPALQPDDGRGHAPRADRHADHSDSRSSAHSPSRIRRATRTSSTRWPPRSC